MGILKVIMTPNSDDPMEEWCYLALDNSISQPKDKSGLISGKILTDNLRLILFRLVFRIFISTLPWFHYEFN
jgi:hypothetical protein